MAESSLRSEIPPDGGSALTSEFKARCTSKLEIRKELAKGFKVSNLWKLATWWFQFTTSYIQHRRAASKRARSGEGLIRTGGVHRAGCRRAGVSIRNGAGLFVEAKSRS